MSWIIGSSEKRGFPHKDELRALPLLLPKSALPTRKRLYKNTKKRIKLPL